MPRVKKSSHVKKIQDPSRASLLCPRCFWVKPEVAVLSEKSVYTRHYRSSHLEEKPFKCEVEGCDVKTTRLILLNAHYERSHPGVPFNHRKRARGTTTNVPVALEIPKDGKIQDQLKDLCEEASRRLNRGSRMTLNELKERLGLTKQVKACEDPATICGVRLPHDDGYAMKLPTLLPLDVLSRQVEQAYGEELTFPTTPDDQVSFVEQHTNFQPGDSSWGHLAHAPEYGSQPCGPPDVWSQYYQYDVPGQLQSQPMPTTYLRQFNHFPHSPEHFHQTSDLFSDPGLTPSDGSPLSFVSSDPRATGMMHKMQQICMP